MIPTEYGMINAVATPLNENDSIKIKLRNIQLV